ncbi:MAG: hypothetical protein COU07_02350 [Candidatus Harrisonbacteria bacterium CG10_big_fil_rev_8_21_14_0_10_40_38]|uniref:Uncharacterized protein n=1 Tax=Candidatus Harrisonbacteria bacterium CG10_big_fil_rev_8_21_14_0_10_40_38 TaxID=1974583 RepID=A0A2H0US32_9BACT|nr:MAG: hypothetical protein COU07_02350 [Candidatus Harrisonbacteria bacterium CG10_big_fil_rev_8_21_14_0_10_40_38]
MKTGSDNQRSIVNKTKKLKENVNKGIPILSPKKFPQLTSVSPQRPLLMGLIKKLDKTKTIKEDDAKIFNFFLYFIIYCIN